MDCKGNTSPMNGQGKVGFFNAILYYPVTYRPGSSVLKTLIQEIPPDLRPRSRYRFIPLPKISTSMNIVLSDIAASAALLLQSASAECPSLRHGAS